MGKDYSLENYFNLLSKKGIQILRLFCELTKLKVCERLWGSVYLKWRKIGLGSFYTYFTLR